MTRRSALLANLLLSLPMVSGLLGAAPSVSAQTNTTASMKVTVPFDFSIGKDHLAAGSYSVERISDCFVSVRNNKTSKTQVLMVRKEYGRGSIASGSHLVFQREGRGTYLTQAWFGGTNEYVGTAKLPQRDVEYAKGDSQVSHIEVASTH
jgi:hypothetical protein